MQQGRLAACQRGLKVRFTTAAALVHDLIEAQDERKLQRLQKQLASQNLLIIDELCFVDRDTGWLHRHPCGIYRAIYLVGCSDGAHLVGCLYILGKAQASTGLKIDGLLKKDGLL